MSGARGRRRSRPPGSDITIGTFDVNADVAQNVLDGNLLFAIDQQPYVQGYLGVTGIYLKLINGNDIGGGQPVYSGPADHHRRRTPKPSSSSQRTGPADPAAVSGPAARAGPRHR